MSQGKVVVRGLDYTITGIELWNGCFEISAIRHGPVPEMVNEPATVFGADGQGLFQGPGQAGASISHREVSAEEMALIIVTLRMTAVTSGVA